MGNERRKLTAIGRPYHNTEYDEYFLQLADEVVSRYSLDYPDDHWPDGSNEKT